MKSYDPEILSPAGSLACLKAAVSAGADAVYFGGRAFNARRGAANLSAQEIAEAVKLCRLFGVHTHLTVNTLIKQQELPSLEQYLEEVLPCGPDAVIVQDLAVAGMIARKYPRIALHASTQMAVSSLDGVRKLEELGFTRVVLARELSLEEIAQIRRHTSLELEVFVHGALCYSVSGRCLLSSFHGGRSGNRGQCAQPCRLLYECDGQDGYFLDLKDREGYTVLQDLMGLKIDAFKIEGRMKGEAYTAATTAFYHDLKEQYRKTGKTGTPSPEKIREVLQLFNRGGMTDGYFRTRPDMIERHSPKNQGIRVGKIVSVKKPRVTVLTEVPLHAGDELEVRHGSAQYPLIRVAASLLPASGQDPSMRLSFACGAGTLAHLSPGDEVYRVVDPDLTRRLEEKYTIMPHLSCRMVFSARASEPATLSVSCREKMVTVAGPVPEPSSGSPLDEETVRRQLQKTGNTPFACEEIAISLQENLFLPVSALNDLRRRALAALEKALTQTPQGQKPREKAPCLVAVITSAEGSAVPAPGSGQARAEEEESTGTRRASFRQPLCQVVVSTPQQLGAYRHFLEQEAPDKPAFSLILDMTGFFDLSSGAVKDLLPGAESGSFFVRLPYTERGRDENLIRQHMETMIALGCDGFEVSFPGQIAWAQNAGKKVLCGPDMGAMNDAACRALYGQASDICLSRELSLSESAAVLQALSKGSQGAERHVPYVFVYGRIPYMMSAQCVYRERYGCQPSPSGHETVLKDRQQEAMIVRSFCPLCLSVIYSEEPCCAQTDAIQAAGIRYLRAELTTETAGQTLEVLRFLKTGKMPGYPCGQGHFTREVR